MTEKYEVVSGDTLWALAERFYGDGSLYPVISIINNLSDPDQIFVGQELEIPYVTYRHKVLAGDTKNSLAQQYYNDIWMAGVIEVANHAGQRDLVVGEWLLIPDLANVGHHTVVTGETLQGLAERWYGEANLWPIISIANFLADLDLAPGQVLISPRLNRRHTVVEGDTLWQLAADNYNYDLDRTQTALKVLAAANHVADPDTIEVGQVIFFPSMA
jgi:nucleoid-associated protein YgaU